MTPPRVRSLRSTTSPATGALITVRSSRSRAAADLGAQLVDCCLSLGEARGDLLAPGRFAARQRSACVVVISSRVALALATVLLR